MSNILITGSNGQLGQSFKYYASKYQELNFIYKDFSQLNICDENQLRNFLESEKISFLINCAAYTNVDTAEEEIEKAQKINANAVEILTHLSLEYQFKLIHFSTDYVFGKGPMKIRREGDKCFPINFYGLSKYRGEKAILKHSKNSIVIRLASVFSNQRINFIKTITKKLLVDKEIKIVSDQKISMVRAFDVAKNIPNLIELLAKKENLESRILHFTNKGYTNWFSVSKIVKNEIESFLNMKLDVKLIPIKSVNWKSDAKRPLDSRLGVNYKFLERNKIYLSDWKESVRNEVKNILPNMIKEIKNED